jgi:stearoyl-CoA desaturase (delta-9 desaturase)
MSLPLIQDSSTSTQEPGLPAAEPAGRRARPPRSRKLTHQAETDRRPGKADGTLARTEYVSLVVYWTIHAVAAGALVAALFGYGVSTTALVLAAVTFWVRMFGITAGYHRYFAHKSYKTGRAFQLVLAVLGTSATQKGPLWWAGLHRRHHRYSDAPGDTHSPKEGIYYAHQGWVFDPRWNATPLEVIPDFARYPELVWLNRWHFLPPLALAVACFAIGGFPGLFWGFCVSTTLLWHVTYSVNSLAHLWGTRRYETSDTSRNNVLIALLTMGEGWHNNHHHYMASARQGFRWWEIDATYYVLRGLARLGVIWDVREPPAAVLAGRAPAPEAAVPAEA